MNYLSVLFYLSVAEGDQFFIRLCPQQLQVRTCRSYKMAIGSNKSQVTEQKKRQVELKTGVLKAYHLRVLTTLNR